MMHTQTVPELAQGLARGAYSSRELTECYLDRIGRHDDALNCFLQVPRERALREADAADALRAAGSAGPLTGIPIAHKDIFCTEGVASTCASRMLENYIAPYDATVVARLRAAGMVLLGKTNMDEFAMGSSNEHSAWGPVRNPWDPERVPGGSSGGSAAAVAARLCPVATGTDTGGSIRQPAAFCGVTGIKPTYGRVSRYGMVAYASSLDQGGVLAADAASCAWLLRTMAGFDAHDSTSSDVPVPDYPDLLEGDCSGVRIGIPEEFFDESLDDGIRASVEEAVAHWEARGAVRVPVSLPNLPLATPAYYILAVAECSSNLARYDGIRYGHRSAQARDLEDLYCRSREEGLGREVRRRILAGTYVLSAGYYDAYYRKAQRVRRLIAEDFRRALEQADVLVAPVSPVLPFPLGVERIDPVEMYRMDCYTIAVNLAGLPALSMPGRPVTGLPVGIQLIGGDFEEARLLALAADWQRHTEWHRAVPGAFA